MSLKTISLNDVAVSGSKTTHIVIYQNEEVPGATQNEDAAGLLRLVNELKGRISYLEKLFAEMSEPTPRPSPFFHSSVVGPVGIDVMHLEPVSEPIKTVFDSLVKQASKEVVAAAKAEEAPEETPESAAEAEEDAEAEEAAEAEEDAEAQDDAEAEEDEEGQEEDAEEDEEGQEEEEEAMELIEFEYKGETYYRDGENQVYVKDDDGDLDDTPIGVWSEEKKKVLRYKR